MFVHFNHFTAEGLGCVSDLCVSLCTKKFLLILAKMALL